MQNNESNNKFHRFWKTKGYYMVLIVCLAAVGVSGYLFLTDALQERRAVQESLSTPSAAQTGQRLPDPDVQTTEEVPVEVTEASAPTLGEEEPPAAEQPVFEQTIMPVSGTVVQAYAMEQLAYNPTTRDWRVHSGVDLAVPLGQTVKAAREGTVTAVYEDEYLGHTVVVQHSGGYSTRYCNLAPELSVAAGDAVMAGQPLGTVGSSALLEAAEEPHLHFEVYHNGAPVDPAGFLY